LNAYYYILYTLVYYVVTITLATSRNPCPRCASRCCEWKSSG